MLCSPHSDSLKSQLGYVEMSLVQMTLIFACHGMPSAFSLFSKDCINRARV
jgi:hypothetical protein